MAAIALSLVSLSAPLLAQQNATTTQAQTPSPNSAAPASSLPSHSRAPITEYRLPPDLHAKAHSRNRIHFRLNLIGIVYGIVVLWLILRWKLAPNFRNWSERFSRRSFLQSAVFSPLLLLIGAGVLQRAGAAIAIAVTLGTLQAVLWWFSPWAAKVYATSVGLPLRDGLIPSPPRLPSGAPMFLIVAAVAVEVSFWLSRTRGLDARKMMLLAGVLTGLIVGLTLPAQQSLTDPTTPLSSTAVVILGLLGMPLGALAGFLAARFTVMLHALAPVRKEP